MKKKRQELEKKTVNTQSAVFISDTKPDFSPWNKMIQDKEGQYINKDIMAAKSGPIHNS